MRILVTNDDGIHSPGIQALATELGKLGQVILIAPDREQSASSHSLTLHRPLRIRQDSEHAYAVDGTPSDCVNLAIQGLLREAPVDLVVSGINRGLNLGDDVTYSGTVSAAFEAHLQGLPGVAFSQQLGEGYSFEKGARFARRFLAEVLAEGVSKDLLLNVNLPAVYPYRGVRWCRLGHRYYRQTVVEKTDPSGRKYYWIAGKPEWDDEEGTDNTSLHAGYVSVTPLHLDLTDYEGLARSQGLQSRLASLELEP